MAKGNGVGSAGVRRSRTEGQRLVEQWRDSGLPVGEYCRKHAVGDHVLRYWLDKERDEAPANTGASDFVVVSTPRGDEQRGGARVGVGVKPNDQAIVIVVPLGGEGRALEQALRAVMREVRQ